jgi:hypothetical protein
MLLIHINALNYIIITLKVFIKISRLIIETTGHELLKFNFHLNLSIFYFF